jgi:hypothetical protein
MITMNDKKVLDERGEKYGPTKPMWETIGTIQWEQFKFLLQKCGVRKPTREELGQLAALNMTVVKSVRSIQDPRDLDHGIDGRNYYYNRGEGCGKNFSIII